MRTQRGEDLANLLRVIPVIQTLSDSGLGFSINRIEDNEPIVPIAPEELAKVIEQSLSLKNN